MPPFSAAERQKNVATAEGRGKESIYRGNPSPVRGERLPRLKSLSPLTGLVFRDQCFPRPSAVATFWCRFAAENGGSLTYVYRPSQSPVLMYLSPISLSSVTTT